MERYLARPRSWSEGWPQFGARAQLTLSCVIFIDDQLIKAQIGYKEEAAGDVEGHGVGMGAGLAHGVDARALVLNEVGGAAERAIEMMVDRGMSREGFGKKLINLGKNMEVISRARIEVEAMRLMVLRAAKAMDTLGNAEARVWVSAVKAMVPEKCCDIIDEAIQMHGAAGISQWFPLAEMWHAQRTLRLADGPDEVHHQVVGRAEAKNRESDRAAGKQDDFRPGGRLFTGP